MGMNNRKVTGKDIRVFLVPFIVLACLYFVLTYINTKSRLDEFFEIKKKATIEVVDSYRETLLNSSEIIQIANEFLDEKIMVASQAVLLWDKNTSDLSLDDLAEQFKLDQVNLYNEEGFIIDSNMEENLNWKAPKDHPVDKFVNSKNQTLLEESIRQDNVDRKYYKYGYLKRADNTFVQIGILAENINEVTSNFELEKIIENIWKKEDVKEVFFTDNNYMIIASSTPRYQGIILENEEDRNHIASKEIDSGIRKTYGKGNFHSCAPLFYEGEWIGTLSIIWDEQVVKQEVLKITLSAMAQFLIITATVGYILYYAYKKDSANYQLAYYDELTGLPNNFYLEEFLGKRIHNIDMKKKAILLLNATNFKIINNIYGYKYGDKILKQIAARVSSILDDEEFFFRFNADRFVLYAEGYSDDVELKDLAEKMIGIFRDPFREGFKHEYVSAQVAVYEIPNRNVTVDKALQLATVTLANMNPVNEQIVFFTEELEEKVERQEQIENTIKDVILGKNKESFYLAFQPKLEIESGRIVGFEALARLEVEKLGSISPLEFIDIAEKRMLIYDLGNIVLNQACSFLIDLRDRGIHDLSVAVNISLIQLLRDEFMADVLRIIQEYGIDPRLLEFEITESVLEEDFDIINQKLRNLKNIGILIAIDDFGTGFSSFARLFKMNIDVIKIDKHFIDYILVGEDSSILSADIISMGHKLGLKVIAEGVEDEKQKDYLRNHKCDILQGYLISKPLKAKDAIEFMKNRTV